MNVCQQWEVYHYVMICDIVRGSVCSNATYCQHSVLALSNLLVVQ